MNKISVVVTARNAEKTLAECLRSVKWADEIVLVDDESTDKTVSVAKQFTKHIYPHKSKGYVEPARNFSISKATNEWILILDADEEIPHQLSEKLREISGTSDEALSAVAIPRKNIIFNKWIRNSTGWWPDYQTRFFRKGKVKWFDAIHSKPEVDGRTQELDQKEDLAIIHNNYETISDFLQRLDRYTSIEAQEHSQKGEKFDLEHTFKRAHEEFLSRFFAREGYRDGAHGLVLSLFESFSMLVVGTKMWEREGFIERTDRNLFLDLKEQFAKMHKEQRYWFLTLQIQNSKNLPLKVWYMFLRKFTSGI